MTTVPRTLLIVDDDDGIQRQLRWAFESFNVALAADRDSALDAVRDKRPPVVVLDLGLPPDVDGPSEGLKALAEILTLAPRTKVIVMTGQAAREYAVSAVGAGAYDFYQKPIEIDVLGPIVERAYELFVLEEENRTLSRAQGDGATLPGLITVNPDMQAICHEAEQFARAEVSVLIVGESGTGKELVARGIHKLSDRADMPFIAINSASIPDQLLESELFGHEKGAFTGAHKTVTGKVELANGGSLFLDEIGDLSLPLQAKLLRFLQERVIERIGGREQISIDVRVISATNKDLTALIESGIFREDLYYRLSEVVIRVPPLRDRPDDTVVIANHLLRTFAEELSRNVHGFSGDALAAITSHDWPGNVRELQNQIKRAVIGTKGNLVTAAELGLAASEDMSTLVTLKEARDKAEYHAITNAMRHARGNISKAAKYLEVSRPKLYDLLRQHSIKV